MENVTQASYLQRACESQGVYCLVYKDHNYLYFQGPKPEHLNKLPILDPDRYNGMIMGPGEGFFIGKQSLPDTANPIVCYDAACPNCYQDRIIKARMQMTADYMAKCTKCRRIYNLDDHGYVFFIPDGQSTEPQHNRRLIRYQVHYYPSKFTLIVSN